MASIPTPRSYNQILGDLIDTFLSETGIPNLPVGDPILSILEAAAQSDLRSSQDIFQLLSSLSLDRASGAALDRLGAEEGLTRYAEFPATGTVDISDTSFTKKETVVFQGKAAPIVGTTTLYVLDATGWPTSGSLYIGRDSNQYEGPLTYTATTSFSTYWTITLSAATQRFHNHGELVTYAQGGNRLITAGTVVQTPQGNTGTSVQFTTIYSATIADGETTVQSVPVVARKPGIIGNVNVNTINSFVSNPFTGASVTNTSSFSNGRSSESDNEFRDRIRLAKQSKSKGTALSIKNAVNNATSTDENKRVVSSSVVTKEGYPTTLYIDDGSGYEEKTEGVASEVIVDSAFGGEQYLSLSNRPVAKAFVISSFEAPFNLVAGSKLAVLIDGVTYEHPFTEDEFFSIGNASAYEIAASINADANIKFGARTANGGLNVVIFADEDTNETIEVTTPSSGDDANVILGFNSQPHDTLKLYKNDRLLVKDGKIASLTSNPQSQWASLSSGETLKVVIDGVNISGISDTYTISDADFINAGTNYTTVATSNSVDSWATVLNYKIPGLTFTASNGYLTVISNLGRSNRAKVDIQGGTLVSKNMFAVGSSTGQVKDYTFNRNLSQIRLEDSQVLVAGDKLAVGTVNTRAFIESTAIAVPTTITGSAELWFCVDGDASIIATGIQAGTTLTYSVTSSPSWGKRVRITGTTAFFTNVQKGDWLIVNDPVSSPDKGAFRIVTKDASNFWIEIERPSTYTASGAIALTNGGFKIVRTSTEPQKITLSAGTNYTAYNFAQSLNTLLRGATAVVYKTNRLRIYTNTYELSGDIALVVSDTEGLKLNLPISNAVTNLDPHVASIIAGNNQAGTPSFALEQITTVTSSTVFDATGVSTRSTGDLIVATRPTDDGSGRYSNHGHVSSIQDLTSSTLTLRSGALQHWLPEDLIYHASAYALNGNDKLIATIDNDTVTSRYAINMYRKVTPTTSSYATTTDVTDADNASASLTASFGTTFDWNDFAVFMKARVKSNLSGGANTTKTILWRYFKHGPDGNAARLQYRYPFTASTATNFLLNNTANAYSDIKITLPSGTARTGYTVRGSTYLGIAATSVSSSLYTFHYVLGFSIASATRTTNVTTLTLTLPGAVTDHGIAVGKEIYVNSTSGSFSSGTKVVTAATTNTISYTEVAANAGPIASIGTMSYDNAGIATLSGSTVVNGDIFGFNSPTLTLGEKINTLGTQYWVTTSDRGTSTSTVLTWVQIGSPSYLSFFPINTSTNTASSITSAINALSNCPVSATAVGGGAGQIADATYEASPLGEGATDPWYYLVDGINFVKTYTQPNTFLFKNAVATGLAGSTSDWTNEDVRLVPTTAKNVVDYLNSSGVSGLPSKASVQLTLDGQRPQISSSTLGSGGSVNVQGGSANALTSVAVSSAVDIGTAMTVQFKASDLDGLSGRHWVALDNQYTVPKAGRITSSTALSSLDSLGNFTLSTTNAWDWATTTPGVVTPTGWQIVKQGKFVQIRALSSSFAGVTEGDVAFIKFNGSTANNGTFRIVRQRGDVDFWIENPNAYEEITTGSVAFVKYNSILPGDTLSINTTLWGSANVGDREVETIDLPTPFGGSGSLFKFKTKESTTSFTGPTSLGTSYNLVQVIEGSPSRLIKKVVNVFKTNDSSIYEVKFDSDYGSEKVGAFAGTILSPLDKLAFSNDIANGTDGYIKNTGLLAEVNKIVYGVEDDPSTYPGYAAAGAKLNIAGPLVKRITVALSIRTISGIDRASIEDEVKSQVASVINKTPVGTPIAIANIIAGAQSVAGVLAVSILSPTYSVSNDLIPIQPFEKPLVLNLDTDILVSFTGA